MHEDAFTEHSRDWRLRRGRRGDDSPWLFGFTGNDRAMGASVGLGAGLLLLALLTDYEAGLFPVVPFRLHILLDLAAGALLAASPWILGFATHVFWPHVMLGVLLVGAALMTGRLASPGLHLRHSH